MESKREEPEWMEARKILEQNLSESSFQTWIAPLLFERNGSGVILRAPDSFFCNWVKNHFSPQIESALESIGLTEWKLETFTAEQQEQATVRKEKAEELQKEAARAAARAAAPPDEDVDSLPLDEQFKRLYQAYPKARKEAKIPAKDEFFKIFSGENAPNFSDLLNAVIRSKREKESWQREDGRYAPQLQRWLAEKRWLD